MKYFQILLCLLLSVTISLPASAMEGGNQAGKDLLVGQVSVPITATRIIFATQSPNQRGWLIRNTDAANSIYIGRDNTVSATTGFLVKAGETLSVPTQADVWAIAITAPVTVCWLSATY